MDIVKLKPATKDYLWAGSKLKKYGKEAPYDKIAECWELSFHADGPSLIASGPDAGKPLKDIATPHDIGSYVASFPFFPVLIKLIDSDENLSVQVHPSDSYALAHENSYGKTEMWYVLEAEKGCGLYVGLKKDSSREEIEADLRRGDILSKLNFFEVKPGESYFIPSGTIHAIGKSVTVIEIQQNSNLTYRLYDYDRIGKDGKKRPLMIDKALDVIDYKAYSPKTFAGNIIGQSRYFISMVENVVSRPILKATSDSFLSITFLEGEGDVNNIPYHKFDTFFIPATKKATINGTGRYVLTTVPKMVQTSNSDGDI